MTGFTIGIVDLLSSFYYPCDAHNNLIAYKPVRILNYTGYTCSSENKGIIYLCYCLLYLKKAFGAHEWFIRLAVGYIAEPNFFSEVASTALYVATNCSTYQRRLLGILQHHNRYKVRVAPQLE